MTPEKEKKYYALYLMKSNTYLCVELTDTKEKSIEKADMIADRYRKKQLLGIIGEEAAKAINCDTIRNFK